MRRRPMLAVLLFAAALPLSAATAPCTKPQITFNQCIEEIVPSTLIATIDTEKLATEQAEVAKAPTGSPAIGSAAGSSLRDFLSTFLVGMENGNLTDDGNALTLDYNLRLSDLGKRVVKIQGVLRKPTLWEPFATSLDSDTSRDTLTKTLDDFDDVTLSLNYAPEGTRVGRNLAPHRPLFRAVLATVGARLPGLAHREMLESFRAIKAANPEAVKDITDLDDITFEEIKDDRLREEFRQNTIAFAREVLASRTAFDQRFDAAGLNLFSDLLNNQPQLYVSLSTHERDALVGPRERSLRATYEMGFTNLNSFRDDAGEACEDLKSDACAEAFSAYAARPDVQAGADASNRVALSLEYNDLADYDIAGEGIPAPFHVDGTRKWSGSLGYGRMLVRRDASAHDGRVDFSLTYEDLNSKETQVDNRWVASAIYTQKLSDTLSLPIGLVWSNHEADVPASDSRVSAHFGLVFKMPPPK